MSTPKWINDILIGGLPAALDFGYNAPNAGNFTEKNPPQDVAPQSTVNPSQSAGIGAMDNRTMLYIGAGVAALIGVVVLLKK